MDHQGERGADAGRLQDARVGGRASHFSASGGQITFGFIYGVSTVIDGPVSSRTAGLDNWEITIDR